MAFLDEVIWSGPADKIGLRQREKLAVLSLCLAAWAIAVVVISA